MIGTDVHLHTLYDLDVVYYDSMWRAPGVLVSLDGGEPWF